jgi:hypothetical protein
MKKALPLNWKGLDHPVGPEDGQVSMFAISLPPPVAYCTVTLTRSTRGMRLPSGSVTVRVTA